MDLNARIREMVHASWISLETKLRVKNPEAKLAYDNQKEAAQTIFECFRNDKIAVTLLALPQVGKTGVMAYLSYLMTTTIDDDLIIRPENVYIISGMNEVEWREQTKNSFPDAFVNVYTRSQFNKITTLNSLENALIIIDECHIAAEEQQQLSRTLEGSGLNTPEYLKAKNVRILQVSATPAHTLFHAERVWGDDHCKVQLQASPKYIGFKNFLEAGKVVDTTASTTPKQRFESIESAIKKYDSPKYHIMRLKRGDKAEMDKMISTNKWVLKTHTSTTRENTDLLFETRPLQHTLIQIKGFWRAGKRLDDKYIGVMYEGPSDQPDLNVIAQSLAGRACGNDKQFPCEQSPLIYCDKKSLEDYIIWYEGTGSFDGINYQSRHLRADTSGNKDVRSSYPGGAFKQKINDYAVSEPTFDTVDEARKWCSENLTYSSSEYHLRDKNGELGGTTHFMYRGKPRPIMDETEIRGNPISDGVNNGARIMPVKNDLGWGVASSARIMPVLNPLIKYIVIYAKAKLRV
jgi:hypothetical protein